MFTAVRIDRASPYLQLRFESDFTPFQVDSGTMRVSRGPSTHLALERQPYGAVTPGALLQRQPVVRLVNIVGETDVSNFEHEITAIGPDLAGTTTVPLIAGVAHFYDLRITAPHAVYALNFTCKNDTVCGAVMRRS